MAGFNSVLLAIAVFIYFLPIAAQEKFAIDSTELFLASSAAFLTLVAGLGLQILYISFKECFDKRESRLSSPTHAGGIVYKNDGNETLYLIVSPKNSRQNTWVLPKGHIENGEGVREAALREVEEEAGVVARLIRTIGEVSFIVEENGIPSRTRIKFYLMHWLFDTPGKRSENRATQWLPFEQALQQLTFPEGKRMLLLAHANNPQ
jgi:8-oxo-dGTP pyrophosphatase MutT (NUDIX family)